jgi:hypothetical protein
MKIIKFIIIILGSSLFIPVSCSISVLGGIQVVAWIDSRDVQKGDSVHSMFSVVAVPQHSKNKNDFLVLSLQQIERMRKVNEPLSFLMPISNSNMETDHSRYSYKILEDRGKEQIIEVVEELKDGDGTIWSQYRATEKEVFPISSRMFYFGYMFQALPYGLVFSLCLYACGKILRRRVTFSEKRHNGS